MKKIAFILSLASVTAYAGTNYTKNGKAYLFVENNKNSVECTVNQLCDITLINGDVPDHWIMSDGEVWKDSIASDKVPQYRDNDGTIHAIIQSSDVSTGNNEALLIGKNYTYHLTLKSVRKSFTNNYVFLENKNTQQSKDSIIEESINFSAIPRKDTQYYMKGDTDSAIKPTEVFNDGRSMYIKLPKSIGTSELPEIKGFSPQGRKEEVLCRWKRPYFVCDNLYPRIAIILGSDQNEDDTPLRVNIYHGQPPSGWKWLMQQYSN